MIDEIDRVDTARDIVTYTQVKGQPPNVSRLARMWFVSYGGAKYRVNNCMELLPDSIKEFYERYAK